MSIRVAVAIIYDEQGRVLVTQRPFDVPHEGMWEFPGGKLEAEELPEAALIREIKEEVGLTILEYSFLGEIVHHYGSKTVHLFVFNIQKFKGNARCCESQLDLRWIRIHNLTDYYFPEANKRIIELIKQKNSQIDCG